MTDTPQSLNPDTSWFTDTIPWQNSQSLNPDTYWFTDTIRTYIYYDRNHSPWTQTLTDLLTPYYDRNHSPRTQTTPMACRSPGKCVEGRCLTLPSLFLVFAGPHQTMEAEPTFPAAEHSSLGAKKHPPLLVKAAEGCHELYCCPHWPYCPLLVPMRPSLRESTGGYMRDMPLWTLRSKEQENNIKAGPPPPLEAILVIFGRRALIFFFVWKLLEKNEKWRHFCAHVQWWPPWRRKNVEKGHLAPSNLTFLIIAIDRNGFRRMKEEGLIYKMLPQIF